MVCAEIRDLAINLIQVLAGCPANGGQHGPDRK
jgi:hypothetical protein